mmetsp:Transcript_18224/g.29639  ORF Transcript_18224/g.29639 Transcript_18224/m.29639 type:complete len:736 (-) Transcript_18224:23-2230(-)
MSGAVQSKPEKDEARRVARQKRALNILGPIVFLVVCEGAMLIQARPQLVLNACNRNGAKAAKLLSSMMGVGAAFEFLVNPVLGRMSDEHGRKPFLLLCILGTALSRLGVYLSPNSKRVIFSDRVASMALVTSFFSCIRAAQADVLSTGSGLALAAGAIARYAGMGIFLGPYLDTLVTRIGGGEARYSFLASSVLLSSVAGLVFMEMDETLEKEKRKPVDWVACNPFSFLTLFNKSNTVATLMGVILLQAFGDGRNIQEVNTVFMKRHLGWGRIKISNMIAAYGAAVMIGALFVKKSIKTFGLKGHTSFSNFCQFLGSVLWGLAPAESPWDMILTHLSLLVSLGAQRKRDAVESITTKILMNDPTIGKGQIAAALANWRSIASIVGPLIFGNAYAYATGNPEKRYIPGLPFFIVAGMTVGAEHLFRSLSDSDMQLNESESTTATKQNQNVEKVKSASGRKFLDKTRKKVYLKEKIQLSHDTRIFRFALPEPDMMLGLPIGKHIKFWCPTPKPVKEGEWNGRADTESALHEIERKYTPSSCDADLGYIDVVIKVYEGGKIERFPDGGKMSQHLESLQINDSIDIAGPFGMVEYHGLGKFTIRRKNFTYQRIGMIAGGTGITPMLQLIKAILKNPDDRTTISLLFANQSEEDILVRDMLEEEARKHGDRFKLWYTVDRPPANWKYSTGFINEDMLKDHMPPNEDGTVILMCGPPPMIKFACKANLDKLGYPKNIQIEF